ncbi:HSP90 family protein [Mycetocola tolaasinivorans]|uniref:HSP90 family protein n=1 Tax=Mycetocola tolaasinivorans TaxID=76635 RepID=A0A3L6ZY08_9MICO|nr:HSP90 family protein [Mycetocola tolaasinivorans]RLP72684.1 HSP90 family protein [Mycetocola tolaasinivorans]
MSLDRPDSVASAAAQPFQVDLRGVVDLLSRHIYSSPQVYLRELLQNGRDAVTARQKFDGAPAGLLRISPVTEADPIFRFTDNGVGLTAAQAAELLSTVGRSSKRDEVLNLRREDFLGQFGVGLLSCFMVSDEIVVRSRSAHGDAPIEWRGHSNGTFSVRELSATEAENLPIGTEISLRPRPDDAALLSPERVRELTERFGRYLPVDVQLEQPDRSWETITVPAPFLEPVAPGSAAEDAQLLLGTELLGARPLASIEIVVPGTGTRGIAYVLPYAPPPSARQASRVYLGRMLLDEHVEDLLPEWAFFVRCVINTDGLAPTASRESFVNNEALEYTRTEIGAALRRWIMLQAATAPHILANLVSVHQLALKSLAVHDDELAALMLPWLRIETSAGETTIGEHLERYGELRFTDTVDEFRQVAAIANPESPIVNGGYVYDSALLRQIPAITGQSVQRIEVSDELDGLEAPPLHERQLTAAVETRAEEALTTVQTRVSIRSFQPADLPALYVADQAVLRRIERTKAAEMAPGLWSQVISTTDRLLTGKNEADGERDVRARLCLNWSSPLVRRLAELDDPLVFRRSIELLYAQAMLAGHRPLTTTDRSLMTGALTDLVQLSIGLGGDTTTD